MHATGPSEGPTRLQHIAAPAKNFNLGRRVDMRPIRFSPVLDEALPREDQRTFRRNGTVSTIRKRARINMLEHVLIGKVRTLCRNMLWWVTLRRQCDADDGDRHEGHYPRQYDVSQSIGGARMVLLPIFVRRHLTLLLPCSRRERDLGSKEDGEC